MKIRYGQALAGCVLLLCLLLTIPLACTSAGKPSATSLTPDQKVYQSYGTVLAGAIETKQTIEYLAGYYTQKGVITPATNARIVAAGQQTDKALKLAQAGVIDYLQNPGITSGADVTAKFLAAVNALAQLTTVAQAEGVIK